MGDFFNTLKLIQQTSIKLFVFEYFHWKKSKWNPQKVSHITPPIALGNRNLSLLIIKRFYQQRQVSTSRKPTLFADQIEKISNPTNTLPGLPQVYQPWSSQPCSKSISARSTNTSKDFPVTWEKSSKTWKGIK